MSEAAIVAWGAVAVAIIGSLTTSIVTILKLNTAAEKQEEIHVLVNSNLDAAKQEISTLKAEVADLKETVALLATAGNQANPSIITDAIQAHSEGDPPSA